MAGTCTPGPWTVDFRVWTDDKGDPHISASVMSGPYRTLAAVMPVEGYVANARIMAAAPKLLAALKVLTAYVSGDVPEAVILAANDVIAEAERGIHVLQEVEPIVRTMTPEEATADAVEWVKRAAGL